MPNSANPALLRHSRASGCTLFVLSLLKCLTQITKLDPTSARKLDVDKMFDFGPVYVHGIGKDA